MTTTKEKTLVEKLLAVRESVGGYVEKKGRNTAQNYNFASEADITAKIYPAFGAEGILFYPAERKVVEVREYITSKGGKMLMTTTETKWIATDGVDSIEVMTIGQGADSGDKGAYKGMAGDKKYAILQLLGIATGDDPEVTRADEAEEKPKAEKPAGPNLPKLFAVAKKAGIDTGTAEGKQQLQAVVYLVTNKKSSKQLTDADVEELVKVMESDDFNPEAAVNGEPVAA